MYDRFRDVAALIGRIGVGVVMLAHGLQKWDMGVGGVTDMMSGIGVPLPTVSALFLIFIETVGAVAFIAGIALPALGVLLAVDMVGAIFFVHVDNGLTGQGGYELVLVLGAAALALGFNGGRFSLDHLLLGRRRVRKAELETA
ncbi:DoxX family protein [Amycolatopsis endophytica]|uniref:Putative oxidoreductase n=1 Tax=Amycolatopsis endophytica TaxID=860233 RepID=A0A853AXX7_9PSEU|nr:DoxX family protein [Amycolatopsis endophytica]NYI87540.1 putative oxidoreductase [Amycolatopsis endophytica]